jgi:hypothetical protein
MELNFTLFLRIFRSRWQRQEIPKSSNRLIAFFAHFSCINANKASILTLRCIVEQAFDGVGLRSQQILATADRSSRLTSVDFAAFCLLTASIFAGFRVSFPDRIKAVLHLSPVPKPLNLPLKLAVFCGCGN